jgi:hypothetical protein
MAVATRLAQRLDGVCRLELSGGEVACRADPSPQR